MRCPHNAHTPTYGWEQGLLGGARTVIRLISIDAAPTPESVLATCERILAERQAETARKAEKEAEELTDCTWALEHGSDLLRARIAEGFKWRSLASTEYFALHTPDGFTTKSGADEVDERKYPDLSEIQALRTFRAALMPPLSHAQLVWCKVEPVEEKDTGESTPAEAWAALAVRITSPGGESTTIYRRF